MNKEQKAELQALHRALLRGDASFEKHLKPAAEMLLRFYQVQTAYDEWLAKTEWVQETATPSELGQHRADILRSRIQALEERNLPKPKVSGSVLACLYCGSSDQFYRNVEDAKVHHQCTKCARSQTSEEYEKTLNSPERILLIQSQRALLALLSEFRGHDLPYGSEAYALASKVESETEKFLKTIFK